MKEWWVSRFSKSDDEESSHLFVKAPLPAPVSFLPLLVPSGISHNSREVVKLLNIWLSYKETYDKDDGGGWIRMVDGGIRLLLIWSTTHTP
jgi:hypothetical protein